MTRLLTVLFLCVSASLRLQAALLSPRQAQIAAQNGARMASPGTAGVSPAAASIVISWDEPIILLASTNLLNWYSLSVTATRTVILPTDAPQKFFKTPLEAQTAQFTWTSVEGAVGYTVYYGAASGVYTNALDAGTNLLWLISGLQPGVTYFFAVKARDAFGVASPLSNEVHYTVPVSNTTISTK